VEDKKKELYLRIIGISAAIIIASILLTEYLCHYSDSGVCIIIPDFELLVGITFGVITTAVFFVFIELHQQKLQKDLEAAKEQLESQNKQLESQNKQLEINNKKLEDIFKTYAARTALISLKVIFGGGDERAPANDETREKYLSILKNEYIDKYSDSKDSVKNVYDLAKKHELKSNHNHKDCNECKELTDIIAKIIREEVVHPFT